MKGTQEVRNSAMLLKVNNLKKKYRMIRDGNKISGNQRQEWEMFILMDCVLGDRAPFCFQLQITRLPCLVYLYFRRWESKRN